MRLPATPDPDAAVPIDLNLPRYDELSDPDLGMRTHWTPLISRFRVEGGADAIRRAHEITRRLVVENGVTYNVYSDPLGADRPWALDPLPFVLPEQEWRQIEAGVAQRSRLLNAVLADLYGPQRLLSEGLVPSELAFGHPNFLWPCHDLKPPDGTWLHVYAADLARAPDGRWWLLADRTQAPSGAGYALENREIIEQVHAQLMPDIGVRRVRGFFDDLRERLIGERQMQAGSGSLAVILTPGPFNETYFEHAYLARQLGMQLVEGNDLTVRNDVVYLKTLTGLRRVHTLLRRLDDDYCDPLELRGSSALGIPGLLGAIRAGNIVVANALGTGVLESAAWLGFLPAISRRLLGEKLLLPEVATWWCGERPALDYVLSNLDRLVIKPTYPNQRFEPLFGRDFTGAAREKLIKRLQNRPYAYVAQEHVRLSQAPVWRSGQTGDFTKRALTIRVYAIATRDGVKVMPGGLARIAQDGAADVVSAQRGGGAKDIWILTGDAPEPEAPRTEGPWTSAVRRNDIPSRLVENLYWLGRYSVRCEHKARVSPQAIADADDEPEELAADVRRLAFCASQVRNRLSARYWRGVVGLQRQMQEAPCSSSSARELAEKFLQQLAALAGFSEADMTRDEGWQALQMGRSIERVQFVSRMLQKPLADAGARTAQALEELLDVCDSLAEYRSRYAGAPRLAQVLELLIADTRHPMALAFRSLRIDELLRSLALTTPIREEWGLGLGPVPPLDGDMSLEADRARLQAQLGIVADNAAGLSDRFTARFFMHIDEDAHLLAN